MLIVFLKPERQRRKRCYCAAHAYPVRYSYAGEAEQPFARPEHGLAHGFIRPVRFLIAYILRADAAHRRTDRKSLRNELARPAAKIYQAPIRLVRNARTYAGKCGLLLARKHAHGHYLLRKGKEAFAAAEFGVPHGAGCVCIGLCALRRGKGGKLLQRGYAPLYGRIAKLSS